LLQPNYWPLSLKAGQIEKRQTGSIKWNGLLVFLRNKLRYSRVKCLQQLLVPAERIISAIFQRLRLIINSGIFLSLKNTLYGTIILKIYEVMEHQKVKCRNKTSIIFKTFDNIKKFDNCQEIWFSKMILKKFDNIQKIW
jgi:hypothetical protein